MHFPDQQVMEEAAINKTDGGITNQLRKSAVQVRFDACISSILARRFLVGSCQIVRHDCISSGTHLGHGHTIPQAFIWHTRMKKTKKALNEHVTKIYYLVPSRLFYETIIISIHSWNNDSMWDAVCRLFVRFRQHGCFL